MNVASTFLLENLEQKVFDIFDNIVSPLIISS